jgi:microcin C transport system substrate-binding protein
VTVRPPSRPPYGASRRAVIAGAGAALALCAMRRTGAAAPAGEDVPARRSHGLSTFGNLKYRPDFTHFDYTEPNAPKGGQMRLYGIDSFDNLNAFILRGVPPEGIAFITDTLMEPARDEPDALYPRVARAVELPADRSWVAFELDPRARFQDGSPVTADDIAFSFDTIMAKGHPQFRLALGGVARAEALGAHKLRFVFKQARQRDLPLLVAQMVPVLSRAYYSRVPFDQTTMTPPLGSGPYRIEQVEAGRFILYRRDVNWWGKDLPAMRGRFNFDRIRYDYFRDRDIAFEAFFGGAYDFREEFTSRNWATQYDKPPVRAGLVVRETLPDHTPSGVQAFFFNLRRPKFADRRVRAALDYAFDFEWTNRTLFYGLYKRTNSMFENSDLAAHAPPTPAELALLEPLRGKVPDEVFATPFKAPVSDGSGFNRKNLIIAAHLLAAAGWRVKDGKLADAEGEPFRIEFLLFESSFQRVINPYIRNLRRLGIEAAIRIVDVANYQYRRQVFDFDAVVNRFVQPLTPGIEQINYFGSRSADVHGSFNLAGIKDPAVDALIDRILAATSRPALVAAVRALDRVLMWNRYALPQWYNDHHNIAYWNKFARPAVLPKYDLAVEDTWWLDAKKAAMIDAGKAPPGPGK